MNDYEQVARYPTLREDQRIAARQRARENLLAKMGGEPQMEHYEMRQWSRFGPVWDRLALMGLVLMLSAAFGISAFHIFNTGRKITLAGGNSETIAFIIGILLVILAEASILALSVIPTLWELPTNERRSLYLGVLGSSFIATVGNLDAVIFYSESPFDWLLKWATSLSTTPGQWMLATLPPALTVLVGISLKNYALRRSEARQKAKNQYDVAIGEWNRVKDNPESHVLWPQTYANALWEQWKMRRPKDMIAAISSEERLAIVRREVQADEWFRGENTPQYVSDNTPVIQPDTNAAAQQDQGNQLQKVADYLAQHPEDEALSFRKLAERIGVSHATIQRYRVRYGQTLQATEQTSNGHRNGHNREED